MAMEVKLPIRIIDSEYETLKFLVDADNNQILSLYVFDNKIMNIMNLQDMFRQSIEQDNYQNPQSIIITPDHLLKEEQRLMKGYKD